MFALLVRPLSRGSQITKVLVTSNNVAKFSTSSTLQSKSFNSFLIVEQLIKIFLKKNY